MSGGQRNIGKVVLFVENLKYEGIQSGERVEDTDELEKIKDPRRVWTKHATREKDAGKAAFGPSVALQAVETRNGSMPDP